MGNMLQQIVAPLHDLGMSHDPFIQVRLCTTLLPDVHVRDGSACLAMT